MQQLLTGLHQKTKSIAFQLQHFRR